MSLRLKLILAFTAIASLMLLVGLTSFVINRQIQSQVSELRAGGHLDLRSVDILEASLEIEGFWDRSGSFVASEVEVIPDLRRPKLRGEIQSVDAAQRTVTLYGVPIQMLEYTRFVDADSGFEKLRPGQRIEVTSSVAAGHWTARKIKTLNVKESDKIKGPVTQAELDGRAPETLEIYGLRVALAPPRDDAPEGAMRRIRLAIQMALSLHECHAVAHELVGRTLASRDSGDELDRDTREAASVEEQLLRATQDFEHYLEQSRSAEGRGAAANSVDVAVRWLRPLEEKRPILHDYVRTLTGLAGRDAEGAEAFLDETLDPFLEDDLIPDVFDYLRHAEEAMADQLRAIGSQTDTTMRVALATSAAAMLLGLVLGVLVWRSVDGPIRTLHAAALRLGSGHLETRVEVRSRDELGVLAEAFNKMASELATTTVSVDNLESVFDSMAGALIIFDSDGQITQLNRAALQLLEYERGQLIGQPFARICASVAEDPAHPLGGTGEDGIVAIQEKVFVTSTDREIPVSFSGAELRSQGGPLLGYVCIAQDLTERKRIEESIQRSLEEKELLLREVHHRVKNNMQVVSSLLAMQSSQIDDPQTLEKLEQSQNRIRSMALIHEQLYQNTDLARLDLRAYLETLALHLIDSFGGSASVDLRLEVESLPLDIDQAIACGLIVNELVTNSLKHAFPDGNRGTLRVALFSSEPGGDHVLLVADNGKGLDGPFDPGKSRTLGVSLVTMLARQLGAEVRVDGEAGTEVRIIIPAGLSQDGAVS